MVFSSRGIFYLGQLQRKSGKLESVNEQVLKENKELREKVERMKTDSKYQEEIARRDFGLVRPDEIIYSFEGKKGASKRKR